MILSELWRQYEADKRIQGFSPNTLKAYSLQLKMLVTDLGDVEITGVITWHLRLWLVVKRHKGKRLQENKCTVFWC